MICHFQATLIEKRKAETEAKEEQKKVTFTVSL
jgi:hypothetical protein